MQNAMLRPTASVLSFTGYSLSKNYLQAIQNVPYYKSKSRQRRFEPLVNSARRCASRAPLFDENSVFFGLLKHDGPPRLQAARRLRAGLPVLHSPTNDLELAHACLTLMKLTCSIGASNSLDLRWIKEMASTVVGARGSSRILPIPPRTRLVAKPTKCRRCDSA
jgi:hypothetical protein